MSVFQYLHYTDCKDRTICSSGGIKQEQIHYLPYSMIYTLYKSSIQLKKYLQILCHQFWLDQRNEMKFYYFFILLFPLWKLVFSLKIPISLIKFLNLMANNTDTGQTYSVCLSLELQHQMLQLVSFIWKVSFVLHHMHVLLLYHLHGILQLVVFSPTDSVTILTIWCWKQLHWTETLLKCSTSTKSLPRMTYEISLQIYNLCCREWEITTYS